MKWFFLTLILNLGCSQNTDSYEIKRKFMVEDQIERRGVKDEGVLKAVRKVEREKFVPNKYLEMLCHVSDNIRLADCLFMTNR